MKNILLVLIVILALSIGGYFFIPQEKLNTFSQYIPSPLSELLGSSQSTTIKVRDDIIRDETVISLDVQNIDSVIQPDTITEKVSVAPKDAESLYKGEDLNHEMNIDAAEVEKEYSNETEKVVKLDIAKQVTGNAILEGDSPEVIKIKKKMEKIMKRISEFDQTNASLQNKFEKIINKNRELTHKLKNINDQLNQAQ